MIFDAADLKVDGISGSTTNVTSIGIGEIITSRPLRFRLAASRRNFEKPNNIDTTIRRQDFFINEN